MLPFAFEREGSIGVSGSSPSFVVAMPASGASRGGSGTGVGVHSYSVLAPPSCRAPHVHAGGAHCLVNRRHSPERSIATSSRLCRSRTLPLRRLPRVRSRRRRCTCRAPNGRSSPETLPMSPRSRRAPCSANSTDPRSRRRFGSRSRRHIGSPWWILPRGNRRIRRVRSRRPQDTRRTSTPSTRARLRDSGRCDRPYTPRPLCNRRPTSVLGSHGASRRWWRRRRRAREAHEGAAAPSPPRRCLLATSRRCCRPRTSREPRSPRARRSG